MKETRGNRLHITFLGKMNTGKSSLINRLFGREISIVSDFAGTTTDVNQKAMELLPLGPVSLLDTAGLDDEGELGGKRVEKTLQTLDRTDIALVVFDNGGIKDCDIALFKELKSRKIPVISIVNKTDIAMPAQKDIEIIKNNSSQIVFLSAKNDTDVISKIKQALILTADEEYINTPELLEGITEKNDTAVLVIPIDKEAPKGRIILPQVQTIRDLLDNRAISVVCGVENLDYTIKNLKTAPKIVITDSQAFKEVNEIIPQNILLTSFSIIFAKLKGDLKTFVKGADVLDEIKNEDKILICESCSHHPVEDDIGRVKIPNLIKKYTGKNLEFDTVANLDAIPADAEKYKLAIQCGGCMVTRTQIMRRLEMLKEKNVPLSNYGLAIAYCNGIFDRVTEIFRKKGI